MNAKDNMSVDNSGYVTGDMNSDLSGDAVTCQCESFQGLSTGATVSKSSAAAPQSASTRAYKPPTNPANSRELLKKFPL